MRDEDSRPWPLARVTVDHVLEPAAAPAAATAGGPLGPGLHEVGWPVVLPAPGYGPDSLPREEREALRRVVAITVDILVAQPPGVVRAAAREALGLEVAVLDDDGLASHPAFAQQLRRLTHLPLKVVASALVEEPRLARWLAPAQVLPFLHWLISHAAEYENRSRSPACGVPRPPEATGVLFLQRLFPDQRAPLRLHVPAGETGAPELLLGVGAGAAELRRLAPPFVRATRLLAPSPFPSPVGAPGPRRARPGRPERTEEGPTEAQVALFEALRQRLEALAATARPGAIEARRRWSQAQLVRQLGVDESTLRRCLAAHRVRWAWVRQWAPPAPWPPRPQAG